MRKYLKGIAASILSLTLTFSFVLPASAYTVKPGDTLSKIAKENNTTVEALVKANNIGDKDFIVPGQEIVLGEAVQGTKNLSATDVALLKGFFDAKFYAEQYPDVVKVYGKSEEALFNHFLEHGLYETRQPNENFNVNAYASSYKDLKDAFKDDVMAYYRHYEEYGKAEERDRTTIAGALQWGYTVRSVSSLDDADGEPIFDTIIAEEEKEDDHFEETFEYQCMLLIDDLLEFTYGYMNSVDGPIKTVELPRYKASQPKVTGDGSFVLWLLYMGSDWGKYIEDESYSPEELEDIGFTLYLGQMDVFDSFMNKCGMSGEDQYEALMQFYDLRQMIEEIGMPPTPEDFEDWGDFMEASEEYAIREYEYLGPYAKEFFIALYEFL